MNCLFLHYLQFDYVLLSILDRFGFDDASFVLLDSDSDPDFKKLSSIEQVIGVLVVFVFCKFNVCFFKDFLHILKGKEVIYDLVF